MNEPSDDLPASAESEASTPSDAPDQTRPGVPDDESANTDVSEAPSILAASEARAPDQPAAQPDPARTRAKRIADDMDDAGEIADDTPEESAESEPAPPAADLDHELSPRRIAVELHKIEREVRRLLEHRDPKRKRRLAGSRRWRELEEDLIQLRYTGRIDEDTLDTLFRLIHRRHYLFGRLRFLALTRPVWNS